VCVCVYQSNLATKFVCLSVCLSTDLPTCLPACLLVCLSVYLSIHLSIYLRLAPPVKMSKHIARKKSYNFFAGHKALIWDHSGSKCNQLRPVQASCETKHVCFAIKHTQASLMYNTNMGSPVSKATPIRSWISQFSHK
jgi:hypothetical protein